jgi:pimeloyl-ACP methyl ester carboxylesterase
MTSHYFISESAPEQVRIHYLTHGNPCNSAVLCIHGLTGNAHDFDFLATELAADYYVIAPDMAGRGLSSHANDKTLYGNEHYLRWIFELLAHLNVTQVHWIGASMGGILGMMTCAISPTTVRSLMLNDVGSVLASEGLTDIIRYTGGARKPTTDNAAFIKRMRENATPFGLASEAEWEHFFIHRVVMDVYGYYQMRYDPCVVDPLRNLAEAGEGGVQDIDLHPLWDAVTCPVLLFRGRDSLLLRRETAQAMSETAGKKVQWHEIAGAGHMPSLMRQDQIGIIHDWLKQQP